MKQSQYSILLLSILSFLSCKDFHKSNPPEHYIKIITFGLADSITTENKGFGIRYYCFINLDSGFIYTREKFLFEDPVKIISKRGTIKQMVNNNTIKSAISDIEALPNGKIIDKDSSSLYCGPYIYLEYNNGDDIKYFFYTLKDISNPLTDLTVLLLSIDSEPQLKEIYDQDVFNEDSIIVSVVKKGDTDWVAPPKPIKSTIKFVPPTTSTQE